MSQLICSLSHYSILSVDRLKCSSLLIALFEIILSLSEKNTFFFSALSFNWLRCSLVLSPSLEHENLYFRAFEAQKPNILNLPKRSTQIYSDAAFWEENLIL